MADYLVQEADGVSRFTLEEGGGSLLLELQGAAPVGGKMMRAVRRRAKHWVLLLVALCGG